MDLGTVAGQRRVDMAQMVRDEVDEGLPVVVAASGKGAGAGAAAGAARHQRRRGRWQAFLRELIDGRGLHSSPSFFSFTT